MVDRFLTFIERVLGHEGGYSNHPRDKGGETNWGITITTARANGYTGSMRMMAREQAIEIYRKAFWERYQCDKLPSALAFQYFDACVNHGASHAAKFLQRACGVAADGMVGEQTLTAVARQSDRDLTLKFHAERTRFYTQLSTFDTFGKGWMRRQADNLVYAAMDLTDNPQAV
ncbi:glycoside hydrolase family 108 protein [Kingella kingae]|uniref:glycoside hydrolase family 108 protein n=1 Tax=Kingella kingae TaxID=504 RepID=UPI00254CED1E|nr:glycoside hydrolase family 108 protein [Kingella kingae]MDK4535938.1 glycoside hydrolase family 108 protein [Kingella kingae]MDK4538983.1 glycoside hydrolase family 108 protein [Kingella kingae]MDK4547662.1 glycoside hydrolase family 108 protein [Kingella kingae]MDK4623493.1 glycoside hydrolase family 108 protein [Kingella kingae]